MSNFAEAPGMGCSPYPYWGGQCSGQIPDLLPCQGQAQVRFSGCSPEMSRGWVRGLDRSQGGCTLHPQCFPPPPHGHPQSPQNSPTALCPRGAGPGLALEVDLSIHPSAVSHPLSSRGLPLTSSLPHPWERLWVGPSQAGWVGCCRRPLPPQPP